MLVLLVILITFHSTNNELSEKLDCADCIERIKVSLNREKPHALPGTEDGVGSGRSGVIESLGATLSQ
jgi:hypothetical protein